MKGITHDKLSKTWTVTHGWAVFFGFSFGIDLNEIASMKFNLPLSRNESTFNSRVFSSSM